MGLFNAYKSEEKRRGLKYMILVLFVFEKCMIEMKEIIKQCKDQIQLDERNIYKLEAEIKTLNSSVKSAHRLITGRQRKKERDKEIESFCRIKMGQKY